MRTRLLTTGLAAAVMVSAKAEPPVAMYVFPAGGQRDSEVPIRVGGLFFHGQADFTLDGPGVKADPVIKEMPRIWFEGPLIHQPTSQRSEDYPRDHAGKIAIDKSAAPGPRRWHCTTSQGHTASFPFIVGDLPEIVETEQDGEAVPAAVKTPVTINGRIFPRQDRDIWEFEAAANEWIDGEIMAKRLGYPLDADLSVTDAAGQAVKTETVVIGGDPRFTFRAPTAGRYRIEIGDGNYSGGQHYIYRLTLRRGPGVATAIHPLGGQRGKSVTIEFSGRTLDKPIAKTLTLPADPAAHWQSVDAGNGASFFLQLSDSPEIAESSPAGGGPLPLPGVANGRVTKAGERDDWTLELKKDQTATFEIFAARLGTRLDAKLAILDAEDKELATNDDPVPNSPDSRLAFTAPADGAYRVRVTDRIATRGGHDVGYRLHARAAEGADYRLILGNESLTVVRDSEPTGEPEPVDAKGKPLKKPRPRGTGIAVTFDPIGGAFTKGDVALEIEGLPAGVTVDETTLKIPFARKTTELFFDAAPDSLIQTARVIVRGTAEVDRQKITRQAEFPLRLGEPAISGVRLAVAPAVPFSFVGDYWVETGYPIGSRLTKTFRLARKNFTGPLQVEMSDRQIRHLQGVTAEPAAILPGADGFSYTVTLPPRMEMGRTSRVQLMLSGEIADRDGRKHRVSYTNAQPEQQMMSIVSEGRLSLVAENPSVRAEPGRVVRVPVTVKRDPTLAELPIRLILIAPATAADIEAAPIDLAPGQEKAEIEIRLGPKPGPFLENVKLRATTVTQDPKKQHEAELELELVPVDALTAKR